MGDEPAPAESLSAADSASAVESENIGLSAPDDENSDDDREGQSSRPRGLWAMMGASQPDSTVVAEDENSDSGFSTTFSEAPEVEVSQSAINVEEIESEDAAEYEDDSDEDFALADDDEDDGWEVDSPLHDLDAADLLVPSQDQQVDPKPSPRFPPGTGAVIVGILSVLLSGLNLLPSLIARIPSTIAGVYALLLGYQTLGSNRRLRQSAPQYLAPTGMLLGFVGIFSGPVYLNELGDSWRNRSTREVIEQNLGSINKALNEYAIEKGHFPAGGTFAVDDQGQEVGMHGWMTSLLPYLGYMETYDAIDQSKPWNDDVNMEAMSRPIPTYLVPSVPHEPTPRGHATAHFAGVGGLIQTDQGLLPTGIFSKNSSVRAGDIADGTSQTIIAGEIARALPAWGSPENWRTIEGPLNHQLSSFGNAAGTGAHFLMGDGGVRFFSNRTAPEILQQMATRNASD